jgi:hypothetical protein
MTTLVIDRLALPETILSLIGNAPRIVVSQRQDCGDIVLTPTFSVDGPDSGYIDPADYSNETDYVNAIPGLTERLLAYRNLPDSEFTSIPREYFSV